MRVAITDREELANLEPADVSVYLQSRGWARLGIGGGRAESWMHPSAAQEVELLLPTDKSLGDYALRVSQVLHSLEVVEGRSQLEIMRDICYVGADVIRLRRASDPQAFGTIPLIDGTKLIEQAVAMVTAAACAAVATRRVVPTRHPAEADAYVKHVRLGHTEKGSFILTVVSRVAPLMVSGSPALLELMEEPFPRRVTRTLWRAVGASSVATKLTRAGGSLSVFEQAVEEGVSANLCEALAGMLEATGPETELNLSVAWAAAHPVHEEGLREHGFSHNDVPILYEAARTLKRAAPLEGIPVTGVVVKLHREKGAEAGDVTVSCAIEGSVKKLSVPLTPSDYQVAIDAHRDKLGVYFRADVTLLGRQYIASNVRGFRLVED